MMDKSFIILLLSIISSIYPADQEVAESPRSKEDEQKDIPYPKVRIVKGLADIILRQLQKYTLEHNNKKIFRLLWKISD